MAQRRPTKFDYALQDRLVKTENLLPQQLECLNALQRFFNEPQTIRCALAVLPTGCGKTGITVMCPYFIQCSAKTLIIAPNLNIFEQLTEAFEGTGKQNSRYVEKYGIVGSITAQPAVKAVSKVDNTLAIQDVVVANAQKFVGEKWRSFSPAHFDLIVVDEAHHLPSRQWQQILDYFSSSNIVFLTATPYRSDGRRIDEVIKMKRVTNITLKRAIKEKYIKTLDFFEITKPEISWETGKSLAQNRSKISYDPGVIKSLLEATKELLDHRNHQRQGKKHQAIGVCASITHAEEVLSVAKKEFPDFEVIICHSNLNPKLLKENLVKFTQDQVGQLILVVDMLKEGFDHPPLSVAVFFSSVTSPVKFAQFIGRTSRIVSSWGVEQHATILTHQSLKLGGLWTKFLDGHYIPLEDEDEELNYPMETEEEPLRILGDPSSGVLSCMNDLKELGAPKLPESSFTFAELVDYHSYLTYHALNDKP